MLCLFQLLLVTQVVVKLILDITEVNQGEGLAFCESERQDKKMFMQFLAIDLQQVLELCNLF